ncbi:MAG TPA: class I SAM-dependent methyltransferase [Candidatus Saccharimonadales bacterium]|nr:class I SAM-dependent methyltransferase [Candidatus Saccharimonadales bacterium]
MVCPVCGGGDTRHLYQNVTSVYTTKPYSLDACQDCQHIFTAPAPTKKELNHIYQNLYGYDAHLLIQKEKAYRGTEYAKVVAQQTTKKTAKVLEVGCMHGYLLSALKDRGFTVAGVELDADAVEYCKSRGLNVTQGFMEDFLANSKETYDIIFMSHVLEHIADPRAGLALLKKHLAKNGKLIVVVPNSHARSAKLFGKFWGYWQVPVHINHFNKPSVSRLFDDAGYTIKKIDFFGGDSLLFLSTLANMAGAKNGKTQLGAAKKALVKANSTTMRHWYKLGGEDMLVVAQPGKD